MREADVPLCDEPAIFLRIATLPKRELWRGVPRLVQRSDGQEDGSVSAATQVLEESEYRYHIHGVLPERVVIEPTELFSPSDASGCTGRLRPRRATGSVVIQVRDRRTGTVLGTGEIEVRSRKLAYESDYRWMVQRIADECSEATQALFAPSALAVFRPSTATTTATLYQRFAFIQSRLGSPAFVAAMQQILRMPHHDHREVVEPASIARGLPVGSRAGRALTRPGPRTAPYRPLPGVSSVPTAVERVSHIETYDTEPNRFVRHVLVSWRALASDVRDACRARKGATADRGQREATAVVDMLDELLRSALFADVGPLQASPAGNTVLQGRPGYRDVFTTHLKVEAAALVDWSGSDDAFRAGVRDVATLYEYWVFLELARIIASCRGVTIDRRTLFRRHDDRLTLDLRRGTASVLHGTGGRRGRTVELELWFNKQFEKGESWTEPMRPDCSLLVTSPSPNERSRAKWLHFDAKYRAGAYRHIFRENLVDDGRPHSRPLSTDLLKMHAYRDAIARTTGAYILYPGGSEDPTDHHPNDFHEILPGLGAFVLRPGPDGHAEDGPANALRRFIDEAIDHLISDGTDEERLSYWQDVVLREARGKQLDETPWATRPVADVGVLLGFTNSEAHRAWIEEHRLYNLRGDERPGAVELTSPELTADVVCLYDASSEDLWFYATTGTFVLQTGEELAAAGYPTEPGSSLYCCIRLGAPLSTPPGLTGSTVQALARADRPRELWAAPRYYRLIDLMGAGESPAGP
jgi:hypothetical protein